MGPVDEEKIAEKAIREGVLPPDRINWCLDLRSRISKWGVHPPTIGDLALRRGWITRSDLSGLYGVSGTARASPSPPRRSFQARAADRARARARRATALYLLFAVLAAAGSLAIELVLLRGA